MFKCVVNSCLLRRKEADEAYALGIARKAQPLDHLQSRYVDFQKRMMSSIMLPNPAPVASTSSQPVRKALATTASSVPAGSSRPATSRPVAAATSSSSIRPPASNGRMQVFVDPTGAEAQAAEEDYGNEWNDLGTRKTRIKENVPEVKKMVGTTIKQAGRSKRIASSSSGASGSGSSKIVPFRDPAPADEPSPPPRAIKKESSIKAPTQGFAPFVDGAEDEPSPGRLAKKETSLKAPAKGFVPFVDEVDDGPSVPPPPKIKAKKVPPVRGFAPFVDAPDQSAVVMADTPKFTPFRDEVSVI